MMVKQNLKKILRNIQKKMLKKMKTNLVIKRKKSRCEINPYDRGTFYISLKSLVFHRKGYFIKAIFITLLRLSEGTAKIIFLLSAENIVNSINEA